jgi:hypothetical protein
VKTLFTLIFRSHEPFVSGESLKDFVLCALTDGIPVDRPCRCERLCVSHEENEDNHTLKKSIYIKDSVTVLAMIPWSGLFSRDWNLKW